MDIIHAIGNTSLVRLRKIVPHNCADILVKLEWENPSGSVKDRMAHAVISRAEEDGRLKPGDTVVEYTGGSTGASLALICAAKGYRIQIVSSDAFSQEKLDHMAALGAELTLVPSEGGRTTKKLILDMIETARTLSQEPHTYWTDQLNNHDSIAGYYSLGEEIWSQTRGEIDAFVHCVGTAASSRGVATVLKRHKPSVKIVVVEPTESSVLLGGQPGPHKIEGVGIGYTPPLWDPTIVDEILPVKTDDAKEMARRIAGYYSLGEEIWSQTRGEIDAFVHCVGTAASSRGVATVLKRHKPSIQIVVVEPTESSVLLGGQPGPHKIEGVGIGYTPPLWDPAIVDEILPVKTDDAKEMARRIARDEALFAGTSSGANVLAALQVAERLGPDATVVTLMVDSGLKYLSTDVYRKS